MSMMVDNFECAGYTFYSKFDSGNLGKVELVRCCEGLGIVGNTVSNVTGAGGATCGAGGGNNAPVIGSGNNIASSTSITSASAIVAATLGIGLQQQHHGMLSSATGSGNGGSTTAGATSTLGLPIPSPTPHATENPLVEVEFNLWTRPDCGGTPYENQNRTWFHFAVTGGRPNQIVKFNVMNLNKQAKLFSQGMHPVTKVGPNGRWERIKDKPSYSITNDVFFISFLHKVPEVGGDQTRIYYAFTFPFTYTELLDQLASFDRKFGRHPFELNKMAYEISQKYDTLPAAATEESKNISNLAPHRRKGKLSKMERVDRTSPESFDETARDGVGQIPPTKETLSEANKTLHTVLGPGASGMIIDENTSESMQQITNLVNKVKIELPSGAGSEMKQPAQASSSTCSTKTKLPSFHHQLNVVSTTANLSEEDLKTDPRDEIYYCRELLTHSIERRRIELLTISSFHRIQTAREVRLRNLFPDDEAQRCHTFKDKKIVFISSRVHPGETPASFVLNGFLSMLLDRKSVVAQTLRRMYVFKIIPFLNPDGVYNGLYRSDTRGHNLNRVYISPCHETQPAIYAARKLIRYYHLGVDEVEPYELEKEAALATASVDVKEIVVDPASVTSPLDGSASTDATGGNVNVTPKKESDSVEQDTPAASDSGYSEAGSSTSSSLTSKVAAVTLPTQSSADSSSCPPADETTQVVVPDASPPTVVQPPSLVAAATTAAQVFTEKLIPELNPILSEGSSTNLGHASARVGPPSGGRSASSMSLKKSIHTVAARVDTGKGSIGKGAHHKQHVLNKPQFLSHPAPGTIKFKEFLVHPHQHHHHHHHLAGTGAATSGVSSGSTVQGQVVTTLHGGKMALGAFKKGPGAGKQQTTSSATSSLIGVGGAAGRTSGGGSVLGETGTAPGGKNRPQTPQTNAAQFSHYRSHRNEYLNPVIGGGGVGVGGGARSLNISMDFLAQLDERHDRVVYEDRSNLFMYIDLHGHASKKGVFMYGNHLPNTIEAVECMLLPRLMGLNSQHFHFDACNFSERNMYYKGKRDGLSKEGSGRVAVYKTTGLIKSYTLECNYNTGKCVNILPPRGKEIVAKTTHTLVPPKYTPAVFEEVGKALGPSILDLTNSNPLSRLPNCEFRTLQGLRNALRIEIERGSSKARVTNKTQKSHTKRLANQLSCSIDVAKENAIQWDHTLGTPVGLGSGVQPGATVSTVASGANVCKIVGDTDSTNLLLANTGGSSGNANTTTSLSVVPGMVGAGAGSSGRQVLKTASSSVTLKTSHSTAGGKISRKVGGFGKPKKPKVLCDVGGVTGAPGMGTGSGKKIQELMLRSTKEQVPRKKIKVSPQHPGIGGAGGSGVDRTAALELCFKGGLSSGSLPNFLTVVPGNLSDLPSLAPGKKVKSESKLMDVNSMMQCDDSFDAAPCCSYTTVPLAPGTIVTTTGGISKLISTYTQAATDLHTGTVLSAGPEELITLSCSDVVTSPVGPGSSLESGAGGGGSVASGSGSSSSETKNGKFGKNSLKPKQTKLAKSTKSGNDVTGKKLLKKKRSLKTDSSLKRKKTRVKPALT